MNAREHGRKLAFDLPTKDMCGACHDGWDATSLLGEAFVSVVLWLQVTNLRVMLEVPSYEWKPFDQVPSLCRLYVRVTDLWYIYLVPTCKIRTSLLARRSSVGKSVDAPHYEGSPKFLKCRK